MSVARHVEAWQGVLKFACRRHRALTLRSGRFYAMERAARGDAAEERKR